MRLLQLVIPLCQRSLAFCSLTYFLSPDCGLTETGVDMITIDYPGCSSLPEADPPVNTWLGAVDCLALGGGTEELCVLREGSL